MICILARRGRFLETILKDGARSGVPRLRREPHRREVRTPTARPDGVARAVAAASVSHCRETLAWVPAENRHGGAPRGVPVAPGQGGRASQARPKERVRLSDAGIVLRSITPHVGTDLLLSRPPLAPKPRGLAGGREAKAKSEETDKPGRSNAPRERTTVICQPKKRSIFLNWLSG
jgi:hypothetical protein